MHKDEGLALTTSYAMLAIITSACKEMPNESRDDALAQCKLHEAVKVALEQTKKPDAPVQTKLQPKMKMLLDGKPKFEGALP